MTTSAPSSVSEFSRLHPFQARITRNETLNKAGSAKDTRHIEVDISGSGLAYECGASLGVFAQNPGPVIEEFARLLALDLNTTVHDKKEGAYPLRTALAEKVALNRATKKFVKELHARLPEGAGKAKLGEITANEEAFDAYLWDRDFVDVISEFPGAVFHSGEIADFLPKANPRLYSIASSPALFPASVHLTVAVVEYLSHGRKKLGLASGWMAHHTAPGITPVPVYLQPSKHFHLPGQADAPMIMVGPGTGIAPFRAFLQERMARGHKARHWLFFGDQHRATDFLYEDDFAAMQKDGYLERLDTAFSRDQTHKVYVQDRMREHAAELWRWLQDGAYFYVCGDAKRMAKDVHQALIDIAAQHGGYSAEDAKHYVEKTLAKEQARYLRDVY
jgi:sulfite reductase (NADPH) flavoprotein alpha-component